MQLRVARLCLDCEELHEADTCPRCMSHAYAFLSNWLPVEERRKWRRPASVLVQKHWWRESPTSLVKALARWVADDPQDIGSLGPATTRAADRAALMDFDKAEKRHAAQSDTDARLTKPTLPSASART